MEYSDVYFLTGTSRDNSVDENKLNSVHNLTKELCLTLHQKKTSRKETPININNKNNDGDKNDDDNGDDGDDGMVTVIEKNSIISDYINISEENKNLIAEHLLFNSNINTFNKLIESKDKKDKKDKDRSLKTLKTSLVHFDWFSMKPFHTPILMEAVIKKLPSDDNTSAFSNRLKTTASSSSTSSSSTSNSSSSSSTSVWPNVLRMKSSTLWLSSQPPTHCFDLVFFSNSTKLKECTNNPINQKEYSSITLPIPSINQNQHRHLDEESSPSSLTASSSIVKAPTNATEAEMMAINSFRFQNISVLFCPLKETEINKMEENVGEEENEKLKRQIFHEFNSCLLNASSFKSYSLTHKRS